MSAELQAIAGFAQVNLLEALAVDRKTGLPWWAPVACVAVVAAAALGSGLQLEPLVAAQKARVATLEAQVLEQTQRLETAARADKAGTGKDQAQALQAALAQQERLLVLLGGAPFDDAAQATAPGAAPAPAPGTAAQAPTDSALVAPATSQPFSSLLEGLSHTRVDGLWLTKVRLDRRTQEVRLEGQTRDAQRVSHYIDDLSRNPRFKGLVLATVEVSRPAARALGAGATGLEAPELASFKLASAVGSAPAVEAAAAPAAPKGATR